MDLYRSKDARSWEPCFAPALPTVAVLVLWLWFLCFTLPSRNTWWRFFRLGSFPPLLLLLLRFTFDYTYTLGNPLRDLAVPTLTWSFACKSAELCLTYASGGPKIIRPYMRGTNKLAHTFSDTYDEYEWKTVDFPPIWTWARVIYSLDVLSLRRVGTSWILPRQGRALEWSASSLNEWSNYLKANRCGPEQVPIHGPVRRFGQAELSVLWSAVQVLSIVLGFQWIYTLAAPSASTVCLYGLHIPVESVASKDMWLSSLPFSRSCSLSGIPTSAFALPLGTRYLMVLIFGGAVCLAACLVEALVLLVIQPDPATSFVSAFEQPVTSPSISRLWGRSWHSFSQRDYTNMAALCPGSRNRFLHMYYVFMWSGVQHSWMFSRLQTPAPSASRLTDILRSMFDPGMMLFFLCQATGILLERAALKALSHTFTVKHAVMLSWARKIWMLVVLIGPGPFFVDSVLKRELMTKHIMAGFSPSALLKMIEGKNY